MTNKEQIFEHLVKAYYQPLYRYAFWICKNASVAEDLTQESFARAWKNLHQLKQAEKAKAWLFTILNRENARQFQKKQLPIDEHQDPWELAAEDPPADPLETMQLRRAIARLPQKQRVPLALQVIAGFSLQEISQVTGLNENTVATHLYRARKALTEQFNQKQKTSTRNHHNG